jgi:hypothetical protein
MEETIRLSSLVALRSFSASNSASSATSGLNFHREFIGSFSNQFYRYA